jgi:hypothetical protein
MQGTTRDIAYFGAKIIHGMIVYRIERARRGSGYTDEENLL